MGREPRALESRWEMQGALDGTEWSCVSPKTAPGVVFSTPGLGPAIVPTNALQCSHARTTMVKLKDY